MPHNETYINHIILMKEGEYENCIFNNCSFVDVDLLSIVFEECVFEECDFSNAKITHTAFKEVKFINCKLIGIHFENCNPLLLSLDFESCYLNFSSFYQLNIKGTNFNKCELKDVDFTDSNLSESIFLDCDFKNAVFDNSNLEKTDFRTSINYSINPSNNRMKKAKFFSEEVKGLLDQFDIIIEN